MVFLFKLKLIKFLNVHFDLCLANDPVRAIIQLRERLGWKTPVVVYGAQCRSALHAILEGPPTGLLRRESSKGIALVPGDSVQELAKRGEEDGFHVYAVEARTGIRDCYNPYDLIIVPSATALTRARYWTITASSITQVSFNALFKCFCHTK